MRSDSNDPDSRTRILCIGDLHARFSTFAPDALPNADLCLVAGDLTDFGCEGEEHGTGEIEGARRWLRDVAARMPVYFIPGNHDLGMTNDTFNGIPNCLGIEGRIVNPSALGHASVYGVSLSPCFDMPVLKTIWGRMTDDLDLDRAAFEFDPVDIVLSHCPPMGCLDESVTARALGSPGLRAYIQRHRPRLVICGHIHEHGGEYAMIDDTLVVNCACRTMVVTWGVGETDVTNMP